MTKKKNAKSKLERKNFDFIVLNSLNKDNPVFGNDRNKISILDHTKTIHFELTTKDVVAKHILEHIIYERL